MKERVTMGAAEVIISHCKMCVHYIIQILMSVKLPITAMSLPSVTTLWGATPVSVEMASLEMVSTALV